MLYWNTFCLVKTNNHETDPDESLEDLSAASDSEVLPNNSHRVSDSDQEFTNSLVVESENTETDLQVNETTQMPNKVSCWGPIIRKYRAISALLLFVV